MPRRNISDCVRSIRALTKNGTITDAQANDILKRMDVLSNARAQRKGIQLSQALKEIEGEILTSLKFEQRVNERNRLLTIQAKRNITAQVQKFDNWGEGLQSFLEGGIKNVEGARLSVDYSARAAYHQYFGSFMAEIEQQGLTKAFRSGKLDREIYIEIAELNKANGTPGRSGSKDAQKIAKAYHRVRSEMVSRQNRAGAYIRNLDGYIMRQTHDTQQIQELGRMPDGSKSISKSFNEWSRAVIPLLDQGKTFNGAPPIDFLKKVHEALYTGVHGAPSDEAEIAEFFAHGSLARSASAHRVLHFKDAESAFQYNQMFGTKNFSDGMLSDMLFRSRNIILMEAFGPNPKATYTELVNDLKKEARTKENADELVNGLDSWRLRAAWAEVSGENEYPANITLDKVSSTIRIVTQLAKMGGVVLSSLGDKAFLQSEMAFQGMKSLDVFGKQFTGMIRRSGAQRETLSQMGIALDAMIGNTISRYTIHTRGTAGLNKIQQRFYDLNFMNWWNEVHKSTAGELMANHLGRNSDLTFDKINPDLQRTLKLYDINANDWEILRSVASKAPNGEIYITPDALRNSPMSLVDNLVSAKGWNINPTNRVRVIDDLEKKLRVYFTDRIDIAVPTAGAAERKFLTAGTQAGTPLGETLRLLTMFKSFPVTISRKILTREIYGRGSDTVLQWLRSDHKGKFQLAQLIAMTTIGGYLSGVVKDLLRGRTPKPLTTDTDEINWKVVNEAFLRGGGAGIFGDFLFTEYDQAYSSATGVLAGPVFGQLDMASQGFAKAIRGENPTREFSKTILNNTPFINLFYIRPILDYFVIWNLQEMASPGYIERMSDSIEDQGQEFIIDPRDAIR